MPGARASMLERCLVALAAVAAALTLVAGHARRAVVDSDQFANRG